MTTNLIRLASCLAISLSALEVANAEIFPGLPIQKEIKYTPMVNTDFTHLDNDIAQYNNYLEESFEAANDIYSLAGAIQKAHSTIEYLINAKAIHLDHKAEIKEVIKGLNEIQFLTAKYISMASPLKSKEEFKKIYLATHKDLRGWNTSYDAFTSKLQSTELLQSEVSSILKNPTKVNDLIQLKKLGGILSDAMPFLDPAFAVKHTHDLYYAIKNNNTTASWEAGQNLVEDAGGIALTLLVMAGTVSAATALPVTAGVVATSVLAEPMWKFLLKGNEKFQDATDQAIDYVVRASDTYRNEYRSIMSSGHSIDFKVAQIKALGEWFKTRISEVESQVLGVKPKFCKFACATNAEALDSLFSTAKNMANQWENKATAIKDQIDEYDRKLNIKRNELEQLMLPGRMITYQEPQIAITSQVIMQNQLSAITNGGVSHFGSASLYSMVNYVNNKSVDPTEINNSPTQSWAEQTAYSTNTQEYISSDWKVTSGNPDIHLSSSGSFGPISSPSGNLLSALNNANSSTVTMTKDIYIPAGVKSLTVTFDGNFVTNEFPQFVGSIYNDSAVVSVHTPSGTVQPVTAFKQELNSANFSAVSGLPEPMYSTGGQTGFKASSATIPVAGGGTASIEVTVSNVGDTAYPSAMLLDNLKTK